MPFVSTSLNTWREDVGRRMLNLDFKPSSDDPFRAELAPLLDFDGVRAARLSHSSGLTFRDASMVKDGTDTVALVINSKSNIEIKHQNQRVVVRRGDATFLENFETGQVGSLDKVNYVSIILPRESIAVERQDRPKIIATRIDRTSSPLQLLRAYIAGLPSPEQVPLELHKVASRHVYDLVKLVVAEQSNRELDHHCPSMAEARVKVALDFMARNFRDARLSIDDVAVHQDISPRYLQKLFEINGIRCVEHIGELRLVEALRLLTDQGMNERTVTDIALACGFADISNFNRAFRRRFGASPTAMRSHRA